MGWSSNSIKTFSGVVARDLKKKKLPRQLGTINRQLTRSKHEAYDGDDNHLATGMDP
jgi:hypothetical protein